MGNTNHLHNDVVNHEINNSTHWIISTETRITILQLPRIASSPHCLKPLLDRWFLLVIKQLIFFKSNNFNIAPLEVGFSISSIWCIVSLNYHLHTWADKLFCLVWVRLTLLRVVSKNQILMYKNQKRFQLRKTYSPSELSKMKVPW